MFQTTVNAPLEAVWAFHEDPQANLPLLAPPGQGVRVESADLPVGVGSRIAISIDGPLGRRMRWVAEIVEHAPPHAVVFGMEARFVDKQVEGPFAQWRHEHEFEAVDSRTTRVVERITYRLPLGPLGWLADWLYVRWRVRALMRHRARAMPEVLGGSGFGVRGSGFGVQGSGFSGGMTKPETRSPNE